MKTGMKTSPKAVRQNGIALLLALLLGGLMLLGTEVRAEKPKPGANSLMTQDRAELEKQMAATEERLTNTVATLEQKQAAGTAVSEGMLWLGAVFLVVGTVAFVRLMPRFNFFLDM